MKRFKQFSKQLIKNNKGQGMVEYILLLVVVVAIITAFKEPIKNAVMTKVGTLSESISSFSN